MADRKLTVAENLLKRKHIHCSHSLIKLIIQFGNVSSIGRGTAGLMGMNLKIFTAFQWDDSTPKFAF